MLANSVVQQFSRDQDSLPSVCLAILDLLAYTSAQQLPWYQLGCCSRVLSQNKKPVEIKELYQLYDVYFSLFSFCIRDWTHSLHRGLHSHIIIIIFWDQIGQADLAVFLSQPSEYSSLDYQCVPPYWVVWLFFKIKGEKTYLRCPPANFSSLCHMSTPEQSLAGSSIARTGLCLWGFIPWLSLRGWMPGSEPEFCSQRRSRWMLSGVQGCQMSEQSSFQHSSHVHVLHCWREHLMSQHSLCGLRHWGQMNVSPYLTGFTAGFPGQLICTFSQLLYLLLPRPQG